MVGVEACERVQLNWFTHRARRLGGEVWLDSGTWVDGPDGLNLMFPERVCGEAVARSVALAHERGRTIVGVWGSAGLDDSVLLEHGFTEGWRPCWMSAPLTRLPVIDDDRVQLEDDSDEYQGPYASYRDTVRLAQERPRRVIYAGAHDPDERRLVGRGVAFLDEGLAGIFDVAVWPEDQQRRGYGSGIMSALARAAMAEGATHAVLNATPDGEKLYPTLGFEVLGRGRTWWLHLV